MIPKIHIIIVTYNAMKWAEKCFFSIRKSSIPAQCIVIDNGSTDGTQDFIKQNFPEVEFIQNPENTGFGKANNLGIEIAYKNGADFFYLMNQDAWIYENSIENLLKVYEKYSHKEEIGILSPMHINGSEEGLDIFLDKYIATNFEKTRLISDLYFGSVQDFYEINFVNAAHWFITKHTIEKVGGFNPYFFHYGEDNEYVNRLHFHQKKILLCTKSKAVHDGKQQLNKVDYNKYQNLGIETKIMNPNINDAFEIEKKYLWQSFIKNLFLGKTKNAKNIFKILKKIKKEKNQLLELRKMVTKGNKVFLKI